ncbi:hypothetical protein SKAU_G00139080 [Synaphobranchus kaupii]|uniref:PX domain-containing protein n=1 Tax=Synaphobranchus kaupii TaxID=118154 RepID=A0A9Q1FRZ6_SYNKA|nr:hypothetical protein SKAU_G00139080 [Synaphobranchus kaupii]
MNKNQEQDEFVAVRVQDPRVQNEGFWNSYVDFKIFLHTNSKAFTAKTSCVRRRYSEFVWLKKKLQKNSGLVPVPNLPGKTLFFTFTNEDLIERRRRGLQNFLDKVVNMTVCLSDSQLHLFLQTQLPVGHIEDCVQGHTPYTVTDAILTYASSNRGWAQEEEGVVQEPSLPPVSYESVDSPAPHLPTLQNEENVEFRASVAETHKKDFQDACIHNSDGHNTNTFVIKGTEASFEEKGINEEDVLKVDVHVTNSCVIRGTEASVEEKHINEEDVLKVVTSEYNICLTGTMEAAIEEKDTCEEHTFKEDVQEMNICVTGAMKGAIQEQDASVEPVHEANAHENNSVPDSRPDLPAQVKERAMKEKNVSGEDVHKQDVQELNTCVIEAMEGTIQEKDASEDPVYQAHDHDSKTDTPDSDTFKLAPAHAREEDGNEDVHESSAHEVNIGVQEVNNHETSNCVMGGNEDPMKEKTCEQVQKVNLHVTNVFVIGEPGDVVKERDTNQEDVYEVAANDRNICMIRAMEIAVEEVTNETAYVISAPEANSYEHESISDSKSDAEDSDPIITLSDTNEDDVHKTDVYNTNTGTTDADVHEHDCIVLRDSDDIQKASYDTKEYEADAKDAVTSVIGAFEVGLQEDRANIADMHINDMFGASEAGVHEDTQDPDSDPVEGHCAKSVVFRVSETIVHKLDDCKADVTETENQELEDHEMENHTDFNGQLENSF